MGNKQLDRKCPVCHGENGNILFTQSFIVPKGFPLSSNSDNFISRDIVSCPQCGFSFTDDTLSQADYNRYYQSFAQHSHVSLEQVNTPVDSFNACLIDIISTVCNLDKTQKIVDIGCGSGKLLFDLRSDGFSQLYGIDISPSVAPYLQRNGIKYYQGSITENHTLKNSEKIFNFVTLISVLEHVLDLDGAIQRASSILKDNGYLIISVPDASFYGKYLSNPLFQINLEHINHFDSVSLCNLITQHEYAHVSQTDFKLGCERFASNQIIHVFQKKQDKVKCIDLAFATKATQSIRKLAAGWRNDTQRKEIINQIKSSGEDIAIYGAGIYTFNMLAETDLKHCNIISFIDQNPDKQRTTLLNRPIQGPEVLSDFQGTIVISVANEPESVKKTLKKMGLKNKLYLI